MYKAKYFKPIEFKCQCCNNLPQNGLSDNLIAGLDFLRRLAGEPIYISSGYRCTKHNTEIGGVENSAHTQGKAADIYAENTTAEKLAEMAISLNAFDGIGIYHNQGFIHLDCRNNGESTNEFVWEE